MPHWLQVLLVVTFVASVLQSLITAYDGNTLRENPSYRPEGSGGILYTIRGGTPSYTHENRRGDVVAKTDGSGNLTFQDQYDGNGSQIATSGSTLDRQKDNSKDTDPTGLINDGDRYSCIENGMRIFLTRDPMGTELMMGDDYWIINGRKAYKSSSASGSANFAVGQMGATKDENKSAAPVMSAAAVATGDAGGDSKFYERIHVPGIAQPNLYAYCGQNPWTRFDPFGLDWIEYNGQKATYYGGKTGDKSKPEHEYKATSGYPGHQDTSQQHQELGPVPEGKYSVNLKPDPNRVAQANTDAGADHSLYSAEGIQRIPDHVDTPDGTYSYGANGTSRNANGGGWGDNRARLDPANNTDTAGRSNFYIHDSQKGYSHGCVETQTGLINDMKAYRATGAKSIDVIVKYQSGTTSTYGGTDKP
jgi:hypothetical protein